MNSRSFLVLIALASMPLAVAGPATNAPVLLQWGRVDTAEPATQAASRALRASPNPAPVQRLSGRGTVPWLVQFNDVIREEWKASMQRTGAKLKGYIPENAFLVEASPAQIAAIGRMSEVQWVGEYLPEYKKALPVRAAAAKAPAEPAEYNIIVFEPGDAERVAAQLASTDGVQIIKAGPMPDRGIIQAKLTPTAVGEVAKLGEAEWIEPYLAPQLWNNVAVGSNRMDVSRAWTDLGLTGSGQTVAVLDTGLDTGNTSTVHPDFTGRVTGFAWLNGVSNASASWADTYGHGTHVAGSVLGSGAASTNTFRGVAYQANLIVQGAQAGLSGIATDWTPILRQAFTNGARVHNNSWGTSDSGAYASTARNLDIFAWSNKTMVIIVAAGNQGVDANSNGVVDPTSIGSPASAKNCISVGAAENYRTNGGLASRTWGSAWPTSFPANPINGDLISRPDTPQGMAAFSSRGPLLDGRVKPDIVAPGTDIISTKSRQGTNGLWGSHPNTNYLYCGGTSMASPLLAGAAALTRQWLIQSNGLTNPSAALVKAVLLNGARNMSPGQYGTGTTQEIPAARPNNVTGWGHVDLYDSLVTLTNAVRHLYDSGSLATGQSNTFNYSIGAVTTNRFIITMAYTDYFPASGAAKQLVNDLDLTVTKPSGAVVYANGGSTLDSTNNVETIEFAPDEVGNYLIRVNARTVPEGTNQPYALVVVAPLGLPTISDIPDQTVVLGSVVGPLDFTVGDAETPAASLTVSATSSNPTLVPVGNITFGGSGANRTVTVTPATGVTGTATITVSVNDGTSTTSDSFLLTVNGVPDIAVEEYRGSDSSSASVYNDNVFLGRNGGDGFGSWSGSASGAGGNYIGTTSVKSRSFAVFAGAGTAGNSAEATRALGTPLAVGESLGVQLGYTSIANGGEIGMNFFSGGSFRLGLKFIGGTDQWVLNDGGANFGTGIGWAGGTPLQVLFRRNAGNGYSIMLVSGSRSYSGAGYTAVSGIMSIDSVQFYSSAQGANEHLGFDALTRGLDVVSASPFDFGSVQVGSSGTARSFVVRNDGGATLSSLATAKSGTNPGDFVMGGTLPASLAAGASASFTLAMSPAGAGSRSAIFSITSNDPDEGSVSFSLNGTGTKRTATIDFGDLSQTYKGGGSGTLLSENFSSLTSGGDTATTGAGSPSTVEITNNLTTNFPISVKAFSAGGAVKLGSGIAPGSITSRTLDLSGCSGSFTVSFKVKGWTSNESAIRVTAGSLPSRTVTYTSVVTSTSYEPKTLNFTGGQSNSTVKIETTNKRAFIDDVIVASSAACPVSVSTTPSGLTTSVTYNGSSSAPTNAGTYTVVATIDDPNYQGSATNTLTILKASATVALGNLNQSYDGTPRAVTLSTTPSGLATAVTYNGTSSAPTNVGTYAVVATITDPNYEGSATGMLQITKGNASISIADLQQTYDGSPKLVTTSTEPPELSVGLTYDGSPDAPINAGTYTVVATVNDANYQGSVTNTLTVGKAPAGVAFNGLNQTYDGTAREVSVTTTPVGLSTSVNYDGNASAPTNAGTYTVVATVNDANYAGSVTNTLSVAKATPSINAAPSASAISYGQTLASSILSGGAASVPGSFAFTAPATAPDAGTNSQSITFSPSDSTNYESVSTDIDVIVNKATATVQIGNLSQAYNGTARAVTVTTTPPGLSTSVTYDGGASAPTDIGSYTVVATVTDPNYEGSASGTLQIGKESASINLSGLEQTYDGLPKPVTASTDPSGLSVGLTYDGSSNAPVDAGTYFVVATIDDATYSGSTTNTLTVNKAIAGVSFGNLSQVYDGTAREVSVDTTPVGLSTSVTYDGNASAPTNAGTYNVVATVNDANYAGSVTNTLSVAKATPSINTTPSASAISYGQTLASSILSGGAASVPGSFAFAAPATAPDAGTNSQSITFSPSDSTNYESVSTDIDVTVNKATATVQIGNLSQAYDGTARPVTVTTTPPGLATSVTYDGGATAPTDIGNYAVVATITDPNYEGSSSATLSIVPSAVTFESLFGNTDPASDSDGDGVPALVEYALGGATNSNDIHLLPSIYPGSRLALVAAVRTNNADNLSVHAQVATGLPSGWSATQIPGVRSEDQSNVPQNFERRIYLFDAGTNPQTFMRLRFTLQPAQQ